MPPLARALRGALSARRLTCAQLATGLLFVLPAWRSGFRSTPLVDRSLLLRFLPIALLHASGHMTQVLSMGLGSVYFTHVIKAAEPFIGTLVAYVSLTLSGARNDMTGQVLAEWSKWGVTARPSLLGRVPEGTFDLQQSIHFTLNVFFTNGMAT